MPLGAGNLLPKVEAVGVSQGRNRSVETAELLFKLFNFNTKAALAASDPGLIATGEVVLFASCTWLCSVTLFVKSVPLIAILCTFRQVGKGRFRTDWRRLKTCTCPGLLLPARVTRLASACPRFVSGRAFLHSCLKHSQMLKGTGGGLVCQSGLFSGRYLVRRRVAFGMLR